MKTRYWAITALVVVALTATAIFYRDAIFSASNTIASIFGSKNTVTVKIDGEIVKISTDDHDKKIGETLDKALAKRDQDMNKIMTEVAKLKNQKYMLDDANTEQSIMSKIQDRVTPVSTRQAPAPKPLTSPKSQPEPSAVPSANEDKLDRIPAPPAPKLSDVQMDDDDFGGKQQPVGKQYADMSLGVTTNGRGVGVGVNLRERSAPRYRGGREERDDYYSVLQAYKGPLWKPKGQMGEVHMDKAAPSNAVPCRPRGYDHVVLCARH